MPKHERRVLRLWSLALPQASARRQIEHFLPASLRAELPEIKADLARFARLESQHPGEDGSARLLTEVGEACARVIVCPIQYQWTLLDGINDTDEDLDGIVRLLTGKHAILNMIPFNTVEDMPFTRPSWEKAAAIARHLHRRGILTKLRQSAGQDVDGGCGQLRVRAEWPPRKTSPIVAVLANAGQPPSEGAVL